MKDKRLDALLESLPITCKFWRDDIDQLCTMPSAMFYNSKVEETNPTTQCQGDIRKCEREG